MDLNQVHHYFTQHPIDCMKITPSFWQALSDKNRFLLPQRCLIFGGETLSGEIVNRILQYKPEVQIINHYGPTETTIGKLLYQMKQDTSYVTVPIGSVFSNTEACIVDQNLSLCPPGVAGELLLGGDGLARGYLNRPQLSAEKFIPNPFEEIQVSKWYRTGDLARRNKNGDIEFLGRKDNQIKIRGYRIELDEIEFVLRNCASLEDGIALIVENEQGNQQIRAFVVPKQDFEEEALRAYLKECLPDYMIPSLLIPIEALPLTANGKVDRKALRNRNGEAENTSSYVAPTTDLEKDLAEIWSGLLGLEQVGIQDNFFELGGDSIIIIQLVSRARAKGYHLEVQDLFEYQTISSLAEHMLTLHEKERIAEQGILSGKAELAPIQKWFFDAPTSNFSHFNQAVLLQLKKEVQENQLKQVYDFLLQSHDALRFYYQKEEVGTEVIWNQYYGETSATLQTIDLRDISPQSLGKEIENACHKSQESLDINKGELMRLVLIKTPIEEQYNRLFVVIHHLAVDGVSWRIMLQQIEDFLADYSKGILKEIGPKTSSYRDWTNALAEYATSESLKAQEPYWTKIVQAYQAIPTDKESDALSYKDLGTVSCTLDAAKTTQLLTQTNTAYNTNINDILICALASTIAQWSQQASLIIGMEGHGRDAIDDRIDLTKTVGWFTSKYPIVLDNLSDQRLEQQLKYCKEQIRAIPDNGIGYGCLKYLCDLETLKLKDKADCWDVAFNYLGQLDNILHAGGWIKAAPEGFGANIGAAFPIRNKLSIRAAITNGALEVFGTSRKDSTIPRP